MRNSIEETILIYYTTVTFEPYRKSLVWIEVWCPNLQICECKSAGNILDREVFQKPLQVPPTYLDSTEYLRDPGDNFPFAVMRIILHV